MDDLRWQLMRNLRLVPWWLLLTALLSLSRFVASVTGGWLGPTAGTAVGIVLMVVICAGWLWAVTVYEVRPTLRRERQTDVGM